MNLKPNPLPTAVVLLAMALFAPPAMATVVFTDTSNVTVANTQIETGGDTTENPDVTGGMAGPLISYTEIGMNTYSCCGAPFMADNLNDGDVGTGVISDGTYAIPDGGGAPVVLGFGSTVTLGSISIYNGYINRDDGSYVLSDGGGNTLGGWTIATGPGASNDGADSFWLTFNTPVVTDRLAITYTVTDITPSFREIQVFAPVPEPRALALLAMVGLPLLARRRRG